MSGNARVTLDKFWKLFGYLRKVVGNLRKMAAFAREVLFLLLEYKIDIFSPPCNILYMYMLFLSLRNKIRYT